MINKAGLHKIITQVENGERLLTGELQLLRDAVDLLDDLASTLDRVMHSDRSAALLRGYHPETTQEIRIIDGS